MNTYPERPTGDDVDAHKAGQHMDTLGRRRRWPLATGLTLGGVGAGALAFALASGQPPQTGSEHAGAPGEDAVVTTAPAPTTPEPTTPVPPPATPTAADPEPLVLGLGAIEGVQLPAPAAEVIPLVEAALGPQFVPPDEVYYPDYGDPTGCEDIGLRPGPGDARFAHWEVEGELTLYLRGRTVDGVWIVDTYEVRQDADDRLSLPFGVEVGMPLADALARMPQAQQDVNPEATDLLPWYSQDQVHVFQGVSDEGQGPGGSGTEVDRVMFGPLHCRAADEQVRVGGILGAPVDEVMPMLGDVLGEPVVTVVEDASGCGTVERYSFEEVGLHVDVTPDAAGVPVVDRWSLTQNDDRLTLSLAYWIGMSVEDALELAWTPDPGTDLPDGRFLLHIGNERLVFSSADEAGELVEIGSRSLTCEGE